MRMGRATNKENSRPLSGKTANNIQDTCGTQKSPRTATPRGGTSMRQGASATGGAAGPKAKARAGAAGGRIAAGAATRGRAPPSLKEQIDAADARKEELIKKLAELEEECVDVEAAAIEATQKANEAEEDFTSCSAEMMAEVAAQAAVNKDLEENLSEVTAKLKAVKAENLKLSQRNLELDKEGRAKQRVAADAEAELARLSKSQEDLDMELERQMESCERIKYAFKLQGDQCSNDMEKTEKAMERLREVSGGCPSEEVVKHLDDAEARVEKVNKALLYCQYMHREGPQPEPTSWESV